MDTPKRPLLMEGNLAIAWGAVAAGVNYCSHYPGSPVGRVETHLKQIKKDYGYPIEFNDSLNEHVATLCAGGASYAGARSMVVMKHVGLNIAADPLSYLALSGVVGGMVIVVGTDPGAHSSTGEQDVHWYASMFKIPLLEPTSIENILTLTSHAFELSEKYEVPVFLHVANEICQNNAMLRPPEMKVTPKSFYFKKDVQRYINVGAKAVRNNQLLYQKIEKISQNEQQAQKFFNESASTTILTRGVGLGHVYETIRKLDLENDVFLYNVQQTYPLGHTELVPILKRSQKIVVVEDQDGHLENQLKSELFEYVRESEVVGKSNFH